MGANQFTTYYSNTTQIKNSIKIKAVTKRITDIENGISYLKTTSINFMYYHNIYDDKFISNAPEDFSHSIKVILKINTLNSIATAQEKSINNVTAEVDLLKNQLDIYSKQKGHYSVMHPSIPNPSDMTELFPTLKPTIHHLHQSQFISNLENIKLSGNGLLE
eukprot:14854172-Ditylum_brightwellii.AAC.1